MAVNFAKDADCKIATPPQGWGPYITQGTNASELIKGTSVAAGPGNAPVQGGNKADVFSGGPGDDSLQPGAGNDTLYGGAGADTLYFGAVTGHDVVMDFGVHDVIDAVGMGPPAGRRCNRT